MADRLLDGLCFVVALVGMEGVAWAVHRHIMHGWGWAWHRSHHQARRGALEINDLYGAVFAVLAVGLFFAGGRPGWSALWWLAAGMTAYGVLYAIVHDGLVHRRWPFPMRADSGYIGRLAHAHRLHHATVEKEGAVAFGFLWARDPDRLSTELRRRRSVRA